MLDAGHAGHAAVKDHLLDYVAVRLARPDTPAPLLCLVGPHGVGKSALASLVAAALGRAHAWVACGELGRAADVYGTRSGPPGRIVEALRRGGVRNPVCILDGIDGLDQDGAVAAALREAISLRCPARRSGTGTSAWTSTSPRRSSWPPPTASVRYRPCCGKG